jgi:hypothetical protein
MIPEPLYCEEVVSLGRGESLWSSSGWRSCGLETTSKEITMEALVVWSCPRCDDVIPPVDENNLPAGRDVRSCHEHPPFRRLGRCRAYRPDKAWITAAALTTMAWRGNRRCISKVCTSASRSAQPSSTTTRR